MLLVFLFSVEERENSYLERSEALVIRGRKEEMGVGDEMKKDVCIGTGIDRIADKMVKKQKNRTRKPIYPIDWLSTT